VRIGRGAINITLLTQLSKFERALLIQHNRLEPQPDLAHALRRWQEGGLSIERIRTDRPMDANRLKSPGLRGMALCSSVRWRHLDYTARPGADLVRGCLTHLRAARLFDRNNFQPFCLRELCLASVGGEEQFTFQRQRAGDVKQVDGARAQSFGMGRGKVHGTRYGSAYVQCHFQQGATGEEMFKPREGSVTFAGHVLTCAGRDRAALMKGALKDGVPHLQRLQGQIKQLGRAKPAILGNDLRRIRFAGHQSQEEAAVGVSSHRRDSSRSLAALIFDGFSRKTSSRISSIARRRSASSASVPLAG